MKKLIIGLTLLTSISSFASIEDGKYLLRDIYCTSGKIESTRKDEIREGIKKSITVMHIIGNSIAVSTSDECGIDRSVYYINDKDKSLRMNFIVEQSAKFENACPNTVKMQDSSDLLIKKSSKNTIETSVEGLRAGEVCDGELVFIYKK